MDRAWLKGTQKAHRSPISVNLICLNLCVLFSLFFSFSFFLERERRRKETVPQVCCRGGKHVGHKTGVFGISLYLSISTRTRRSPVSFSPCHEQSCAGLLFAW